MCYTNKIEDVQKAELELLSKDTESYNGETNLHGLAISGGGIRSASFATGVLQALAANNLLKKIDYLSTVSGGGYIGSSLTWFLSRTQTLPPTNTSTSPVPTPIYGTGPDNFPFGKRKSAGRENTGSTNDILNFIRQHGNYLTPGKGVDGFSLIVVALRAMSVSIFVYLSLLTVLMVSIHQLSIFINPFLSKIPIIREIPHITQIPNAFLGIAALGSLLLLFFSGVYSFLTFLALWVKNTKLLYDIRMLVQTWFGRGVAFCVIVLIVALLPMIYKLFVDYEITDFAAIPAGIFTVIGSLIGLLHAKRSHSPEKEEESGGAGLVVVGALLFLFGLLFTAYFFSKEFFPPKGNDTLWGFSEWLPTIILGSVALLVGLLVNTNLLGIHRMYRDRLMETFLPNMGSVKNNKWEQATDADNTSINEVCQSPKPRPYHLINTNIILSDSEESQYRGRSGDSFILSPLYCGSRATGWRVSQDYMSSGKGADSGCGITLPTAMAISGAAVNPNAGVAGQGPTTNRLVSIFLSLLNIRTGYWAANPKQPGSSSVPPNFLYPGLRDIFSAGLHENAKMVELTDGGHFENLGIYELIQRRVKVIISIDGGEDPKFKFDDLGNAIERVRVDFGALITFDSRYNRYRLKSLLPGSSKEGSLLNKKYALAERGFAIAKIRYPKTEAVAEMEGTLIYIDTTMVPNLPQDVYSYKSAHDSFPDQSTADQFFDEGQFEAYRELGYAIAKDMIKANSESGNRWI